MCQTLDYKMACGHWHDPQEMLRTLTLCGACLGGAAPTPNPDIPQSPEKCDACKEWDKWKADKAAAKARKKEEQGGCCLVM
jgi:hypothetical protein